MPRELAGIPFASWREAPRDGRGWQALAWPEIPEPEFKLPAGRKAAAGAVIVEDDGRIWAVSPSNAFGGYMTTFPKGKVEDGLSLQACAIKEVFEESGLRIELIEHLIDVTRTSSHSRYYQARRVGGSPADMGWESQSVRLIPLAQLSDALPHANDAAIIAALIRRKEKPAHGNAATSRRIARASDWPGILPMSATPELCPLDLEFTRQQFENLKRGCVPQDMNQKWFAFFEQNCLSLFRSWTGFFMFCVHFRPVANGALATHAELNLDREHFNGSCEDACKTLHAALRHLANDEAHPIA